jgi:hypothetical protein
MIIELTDKELTLARVALRAYRNDLLDEAHIDDWVYIAAEDIQRLHDKLERQ